MAFLAVDTGRLEIARIARHAVHGLRAPQWRLAIGAAPLRTTIDTADPLLDALVDRNHRSAEVRNACSLEASAKRRIATLKKVDTLALSGLALAVAAYAVSLRAVVAGSAVRRIISAEPRAAVPPDRALARVGGRRTVSIA